MATTGIVKSGGAPKTGAGSCGTNSVQTPIGYIGAPIGTKLDMSADDALIELIGAGTAFILKGTFITFEAQNEESPKQEGSVGLRRQARDGKPRDMYTIAAPIGVLNQLDSLNSSCSNYDFFRILADGRIEGHSFDVENNTLQGYTSSMIAAETITTGSDESPAQKALMIDYLYPKQHNANKSVVNPSFDVLTVDGIAVTYLKLNDDGDVIVAYDSGEYDLEEEARIYGLESEFIESTTGATISGITESPVGSGIYTGFTAGDKPTLSDPADQTEDLRYWAKNSVTIPA